MRSYNLLHELAKHHDVDVFALNQKRLLGSYFPSVAAGIKAANEHLGAFINRFAVEEIPTEERRWGRQLQALTSLFRRTPYSINWLESESARRQIAQWIQTSNYDAVHFDTISLAIFLPPEIKCPTVMDHHNIESHMMLRRALKEENFLRRWYFRQEANRLLAFEKKFLRKFTAHIVCSDDDRERILEIDSELDVAVIPNGIALEPYPVTRNPVQPPRLLFIGGLSWYPNQDAVHYIIDELWERIKIAIPNIEMHIVGKNPSPKIVQTAANDPQFKVHGYVEDISEFYSQALAYLCPIRDGGGTKLKILDALAHKLPVVAHPLACEGIEAIDGKHVLLAETPEAFVEKILLLQNPALNAEIGESGAELIKERYDFQAIGLNLSNLFHGIARAQPSVQTLKP
ncbi:MAG TPA: glycosyltransferase family 4 protein [Spongiibacteraceae bacterium]|nr:glycosyltransferase family 4 protein [Spongiibacteraceae bacterium]